MKQFFFVVCFLILVTFSADFQDKKGYYSISNIHSWRTTKINNNTYRFKGSGDPLKAVYKFPNMILTTQEIEGTFQLKPNPMIDQLKVMKDVSIEFIGTEKRHTMLNCEVINYNGHLNKIVLPHTFKLISSYVPESQMIQIEGQKGELFLYPSRSNSKKSNLLLKGSIEGPVLFEISNLKKSNSQKSIAMILKGKADHMTFDDTNHHLILTGNVFIDTDQESFSGTFNATKAVITFDQYYQIIDMHLEGKPGYTTLNPKKNT